MPRLKVCTSGELVDGGAGVRFEFERPGGLQKAFAIRFRGQVYGYVNRCAHVPVGRGGKRGEFFDTSKLCLICSTHGALYTPETGHCVAGPCRGRRLEAVVLEESGGLVWMPHVPVD